MNDTTRETLEHLAIETLRRMDRTLVQIRLVNNELARLRDTQKAEIKKVEEYLHTIEQADPSFDKDAWLNYAKREMI